MLSEYSFKSESGMSLVELIMAIGIFSLAGVFLTAALTQFIIFRKNQENYLEFVRARSMFISLFNKKSMNLTSPNINNANLYYINPANGTSLTNSDYDGNVATQFSFNPGSGNRRLTYDNWSIYFPSNISNGNIQSLNSYVSRCVPVSSSLLTETDLKSRVKDILDLETIPVPDDSAKKVYCCNKNSLDPKKISSLCKEIKSNYAIKTYIIHLNPVANGSQLNVSGVRDVLPLGSMSGSLFAGFFINYKPTIVAGNSLGALGEINYFIYKNTCDVINSNSKECKIFSLVNSSNIISILTEGKIYNYLIPEFGRLPVTIQKNLLEFGNALGF